MNFLFATNSPPQQPSTTLACNTALSHHNGSSTALTSSPSAVSPTTSSSLQDIELLIDIEASFHGVLLGLPEESLGAVLNATAILHVRKKPIRASKLTATFDGRIKVQCSDGATFGPEQYRERVLAHKDWVLWEAGSSAAVGSGSKNHIPVGTHYYPLSIQLDGALPPTFSGKHGSIRYILSSTLLRPLFYSDINTVQDIEIKRCLVSEAATNNHHNRASAQYQDQLDLGSLLELLRYTATSPPIAHLEGGLIHIDLTLEPLPPGSYIYSIAYGLKEVIHYRSSATGNVADNKAEILYPIGQQTVIIPRDQQRERSMSSAGAGASTRQLLELRPCPLLTNVDTITPLIEIHHRITCNVAIVLPDPVRRRNTISGNRSINGFGGRGDHTSDQHGGAPSGGGILRRLNLAPQPLTPSLNLVDSTGTEVVNNVVLLGEPTHSIIEPAPMPASVELNDAPPPPPASQIESTLLEFPIILTSRYPTVRTHVTPTHIDLMGDEQIVRDAAQGGENGYAYQALNASSYSSTQFMAPSRSRPIPTGQADHPQQAVPIQQFVHNQIIAPTIIPTTGTTIQPMAPGSTAVPQNMSTSPSSSISSRSSTDILGTDQGQSSSSSRGSPEVSSRNSPSTSGLSSAFTSSPNGSPMNVSIGVSSVSVLSGPRGPARSGISDGLRAAAAAAATPQSETESVTSPLSSLSRPPSYGRQTAPQHTHTQAPSPLPSQDELPKYEDVMEYGGSSINNNSNSSTESGLGITIPRSSPMPMPMHVPCRGIHSTSPQVTFSPQSVGMSHSPLQQQIHRNNSGRILASSSASNPISPATEGAISMGRDGQRSSPQAIRGHSRTGSSTSMLHATSLTRSQQSSNGFLSMTPTTTSTTSQLQYSFPTQSPIQRQASIGHQQQQQQRHQRQRSVGAATIMGSLGRNGGYLSQQPAPLTMSPFDCMASSILVSHAGRATSPPAYVE
ncbi:Arrestin domain-containing protein 2 [Linnemannia exigua]|uniref:Arrestin domain-containing protein 2 n=1 Tax=Linnemannia exigua TaxID=604196 RepID=A0AAD4H7C1_9FUNG|nr:Arrestin domain-containing protein 2 [Linnemannia exigua]